MTTTTEAPAAESEVWIKDFTIYDDYPTGYASGGSIWLQHESEDYRGIEHGSIVAIVIDVGGEAEAGEGHHAVHVSALNAELDAVRRALAELAKVEERLSQMMGAGE
jgi:hypothetical protein